MGLDNLHGDIPGGWLSRAATPPTFPIYTGGANTTDDMLNGSSISDLMRQCPTQAILQDWDFSSCPAVASRGM